VERATIPRANRAPGGWNHGDSNHVTKHNLTMQAVPALMALLGRAGLTFVDIGGRGAAMGQLVPLAPIGRYITCEPDVEEARRLADTMAAENMWRGFTVVTEAIGSRRGEATLYLTRQLGMSSLLEPDPAVTKHIYLSEKFGVESTVTVPLIPLDDAAEQYGFTDACFLKIDTQGTELDILRSGPRLLRDSLVGVYVECNFRPFYKDQSLFADVDAHLRQNGLSLFTLSRANLRRAGYRPAVYSRRVTTWSHCLYLREPDTLEAAGLAAALPRLLGLALAFHHYDLAFEIVDAMRDAGQLSIADCTQVMADVESVAAFTTRTLGKKAARQGVAETFRAADFRDRKRVE
jgi:FkbM family methyltransferase